MVTGTLPVTNGGTGTTTSTGTGSTVLSTSPTLTTPTINNPTLNVDTISEFTGANGVTVDGLNIKDGALVTANSVGASQLDGIDKSLLTTDSNPYKFHAYKTGSQTGITDVTITKVTFPAERFDTNNNFDSATNYRYTAPVDGFYQINAILTFLSPGNTMVFTLGYLYKNGSNLQTFNNSYPAVGVGNQVYATGNLATLVQLTAGDYLEIFGYADVTSSTVTFDANSNFSGFLVSRT